MLDHLNRGLSAWSARVCRARLGIARTAPLVLALVLIALPGNGQELELVWSDEFDGTEVDPSKWIFQNGDGCPDLCGWGNSELQYYLPGNAEVADGTLSITAKEESFGGAQYTSARLRTLGRADWRYGRFEARARVPSGRGLWPAVWMLPTQAVYGVWAASGEIDIMEIRGSTPNTVLGTLHFGGTLPNNTKAERSFTLPTGDFSEDFHEFAVEWEPWEMRWYVDGQLYSTLRDWYSENGPFPAPFDENFYILLNLAVGGWFDGPPDGSTIFPQKLEIDYVRAYRWVDPGPPVELTSPSQGQEFAAGETISIEASFAAPPRGVEEVTFFQGDGLLGTSRTEPFTWAVPDASAGCYQVSASAVDEVGWTTASDTVGFTVGGACPERAPYLIQRGAIPGTIEFENYDLGGDGVAYHDATSSNDGGAHFRLDEGVDVQTNAGAAATTSVTLIEPGEWTEYSVEVAATEYYDMLFRVASSSPLLPTFHLEFDGVDRTGPIEIPDSGDIQTFATVRRNGIFLEAGPQIMRFYAEGSGFALDNVQSRRGRPTGVDNRPDVPREPALLGAYPDPFTDVTTIRFDLPLPGHVDLRVYDVLGRHVETLISEGLPAGVHNVSFRGTNRPTGLYTYVLRGGGTVATGRLLLAR